MLMLQHAVALEFDVECGICHTSFNAKKTLTDRMLLEFTVDEKGKAYGTMIGKHLSLKEKKE